MAARDLPRHRDQQPAGCRQVRPDQAVGVIAEGVSLAALRRVISAELVRFGCPAATCEVMPLNVRAGYAMNRHARS